MKDSPIRLRKIELSDLKTCSEFPYSLSSVEPLSNRARLRRVLTRTGFWRQDEGALAIVETKTGRLVGTMQFSRSSPVIHGYDIGYLLHHPDDRGKRFASSGLRLMTALLFDQRPECHRLQLVIDTTNLASQHVAEACRYQREGILRQAGLDPDVPRDCFIYSRLRSDP